MTTKHVYDFYEGDKSMVDLLGGKGANLAEMANLGLPVPPGFTITTEACREYLSGSGGKLKETLWKEVLEHVTRLEKDTGKKFGGKLNPLLVSVRSGAKFSMPGMMDTVLNLGLNEETISGLSKQTGDNIVFAWESYSRFLEMYTRIVLGQEPKHLVTARSSGTVIPDVQETQRQIEKFKKALWPRSIPVLAQEQLRGAIRAVFDSWNGKRAVAYREQNNIPHDLGTAVSVVSMVFGNRGPDSGTGVVFTRDPATGEKAFYGDYLPNAQGEDVVAGTRNTFPFEYMKHINPRVFAELSAILERLEQHYKDMCDVEFTVEEGKLWVLQVRSGKRTPLAELTIAADLYREGLIPEELALQRVHQKCVDNVATLQVPTSPVQIKAGNTPIARGLGVSPGIVVGEIVLSSEDAVKRAEEVPVILVREETKPDDYVGMLAAKGVVTFKGGKNSHAAVVARSESIPTVVGVGGSFAPEGHVVTVDGSTGLVYEGDVTEVKDMG